MTDLTSVENTIATAAPLAAAMTGNPEVALALKLAPVAIQLLQNVQTLAQAGAITPQQLADIWAQIGSGIATAHAAWDAMNAQDAAKTS